MPAGERGGIAHPVLDRAALEGFHTFDADAAWLKGAEARRDHYGTRVEAHAARGREVEAPVLASRELRDLVSEVQLRLEGLDLLQQPVDQFLRPAHR